MTVKNGQKEQTAREFIEAAIEKHPTLFIPEGKVTWRVPTGSLGIDRILGGGIPGGRLTQVYGDEGVGKTTIVYNIIGQAQRLGYPTALLPLEGTYDENYARACGVDVDDRDTFTPYIADFGEIALNALIGLIKNTNTKLIALDSIAATNPRANVEKLHPINDLDKGDKVAAKAKLVTEFIEKALMPMTRRDVAIICVNQYRSNINTGFGAALAKKTIPAGGKALQYYTTLKLKLFRNKGSKEGKLQTTVVVEKGKDWYIDAFKACNIEIEHGKGINKEKEIIVLAEELGIIKKGGAWFKYEDYKWQGVDGAVAALLGDENLKNELTEKILTDKNFKSLSVSELNKLEDGDEN